MLPRDAHESLHRRVDGRRLRPGSRTRLAAVLAGVLLPLMAGSRVAAGPPVGLSVRLEARAAAQRGLNLLLTHQRTDGSWAGDAVATAQVLICLENAPEQPGETRRRVATAQAVAYLCRTVADACAPTPGDGSDPLSVGALAVALTALARDGISTHRDLLAQGRACLSGAARPLDLPDGTRALAFGALQAVPPDAWTTCAAIDGLLATSGLEPAWPREGYRALAAYLHEAWRALPGPAPGVASSGAVPAQVGPAAAVLRGLLCLGSSPVEPSLADALGRLAQAPPRDPSAAFALAEALSLARSDTGAVAGVPLAGWRDRLIEALLGAQQGDGGWPAGAGPRDGATALALRALQVAAGPHLADSDPALP